MLVVDVDVLVGGIEKVAQECYDTAFLLIDELWPLGGFLHLGNGVLPPLVEDFEFRVEFGCSFAFSNCPHDDSAIAGLYALDDLLEPGSLFTAFDFGRY